MKLQQLRYLTEVVKQGLSISDAAEKLHTSQPGVSKQIRLLEDELGVQVFIRNGKRVVNITEPGKEIIAIAERILVQAKNLKQIASDFVNVEGGNLTIATTHTQARYILPKTIQKFSQQYPKVRLCIKQSSPAQVAEMVIRGDADLAISTEEIAGFSELATIACDNWNRTIIVPRNHALLSLNHQITLQDIVSYPLITYDISFAGRTKIDEAFDREKLIPNIILTATDSDIIKTYVELGLGVGILASPAYELDKGQALAGIDASHLFETSTTLIGFRKEAYLRGFAYNFIELFTPNLTRSTIKAHLIDHK